MDRKSSRVCVYCGLEATTRDHVVPRCLLEREYPDNLPTVPCCRACNEERSRDEQYFAVALAQVGFHPTLQEKLVPGGAVDRALERSPKLDDRIIESLSVAADGRVYFAPEMDRMAKVAQKVAFGLYCDRYQLGKVPDIREFRMAPISHSEEAMNHVFVVAHTERFAPRRWTDLQEGVFSYMFVRNWVWSDLGKLACIMRFYETLWAAVICPWPSRGSGSRRGSTTSHRHPRPACSAGAVDSSRNAGTLVLVTDFDEWLDSGNEPVGFENAYALYRAVHGESIGSYKATTDKAKGRVYIKGPEGPALAIVSEKAKNYFVRLLRRRYMDGDGPEAMDPLGWYMFMQGMSKED